jgi:hypothetical protein
MIAMKSLILRAVMLAICSSAIAAQDLSPREILSKHLAALGSREARAGVSTLIAIGNSGFETNAPAVKGHGRAIVVSDPANLYWVMSLNSKQYSFEKIGYFRGKPNLPFMDSGRRSLLGAFLSEHSKVLESGLFGGSMSLRWAMLHLEKSKAKLTSGADKTVNGRKAHGIVFYPGSGSGSSEFTIKLYFDAETFLHVRSEYRREIPAKTPVFGRANQIASSTLTLTEHFSDFKSVDGLVLPFVYRVDFDSNSNSSDHKSSWGIKVEQYVINQKLTADFFTFDEKSRNPIP